MRRGGTLHWSHLAEICTKRKSFFQTVPRPLIMCQIICEHEIMKAILCRRYYILILDRILGWQWKTDPFLRDHILFQKLPNSLEKEDICENTGNFQEWLETHMVEDQYDSLENIGGSLTRTHSSKRHNIKSVEKNNKKENVNTNQDPKTERKEN